MSNKSHTHKLRPIWLLLCSPAWHSGYHKVLAHAVCLDCREAIYVAAWQSPRHLAGRAVEEHD